jgi:hypothetical protein
MFKSLLSKLDTGCGIKRWLEVRGQGLGSGQLSAISYKLLVFSFQFSVFSLPELREDACLRPTFTVLSAQPSQLQRSAHVALQLKANQRSLL